MELLLTNTFKTGILVFYLIMALLILSFNWLYLSRTINANRRVGIFPPKNIKYLVNLSIFIAIFTFAFVIFFLIFGNY